MLIFNFIQTHFKSPFHYSITPALKLFLYMLSAYFLQVQKCFVSYALMLKMHDRVTNHRPWIPNS